MIVQVLNDSRFDLLQVRVSKTRLLPPLNIKIFTQLHYDLGGTGLIFPRIEGAFLSRYAPRPTLYPAFVWSLGDSGET